MSKDRVYGHTQSGKSITDEAIETLAAEAEAGYEVDAMLASRGKRGRPALGSAPASVESVRLDPELRDQLLERAKADGTTTSELIREALRRFLKAARPQGASARYPVGVGSVGGRCGDAQLAVADTPRARARRGPLAWLAGHWLLAVRNHYRRSPLAPRVVIVAMPRSLDRREVGAVPTFLPRAGDDTYRIPRLGSSERSRQASRVE
jgi:uncharacterized protein (DUF4415 family)